MDERFPGIKSFRGKHAGADIYVLGAGSTLNYLDQRFFDGKVTIAVNAVARYWPIHPTYIFAKEWAEDALPASGLYPDVPIIISRFPGGGSYGDQPSWVPNMHVFNHEPNQVASFDAEEHWPADPDSLVVSWSTITSAMHFAAYLGAATIVLVGHDCGTLDGESYVRDYAIQATTEWLSQIEHQTIGVKRALERRYGCRVYSLNPFINYNLEGVKYVGRNRINA